MTATILTTQAAQSVPTTRTIAFTIPIGVPDPKFNLGDRVIAFIDEDPENADVHAGYVTGIYLEDGEWTYKVLPGDDELLYRLCNCSNPEDYPWLDECDLEFFTPTAQAKAEWLLSEQPSYEEVRARQLLFTFTSFPASFHGDEYSKYLRQEWNELMDSGYIPAHLGRMED